MKAICPHCGAPESALVRLVKLNDPLGLMVECLDCHRTPTREACEEAAKKREKGKK